jgi:ribose transport system permease protein
LLIARLRVIAFIATLVTLYLGRGLALWITETRAMNLPPAFHDLGAAQLWGAPVPVLVFASLAILAHLTLGCTPYGRQLYSIGQDSDRARRAGVMVGTLVGSVYLVSGLCAALGGILSLSQIGSVSPTFGFQKEFTAIAAAVLGGTSLFGGRGTVLPGTVMGALLMQSVENGLVIINANPYLYPLISSVIIFIAVLTDSMRSRWMELFHRRRIIP